VGVSPIISLTGNDAGVLVTELATTVELNGDFGGNPRTEIKYKKDGETIVYSPPASGILPMYTNQDAPYPQQPGQVWLRYDSGTPNTSISGYGYIDGQMMENFEVHVASPNQSILICSWAVPWHAQFGWWDGMPTPGEATVLQGYGQVTVEHYHTTWQTVIDVLTAWCDAIYLMMRRIHSRSLRPFWKLR